MKVTCKWCGWTGTLGEMWIAGDTCPKCFTPDLKATMAVIRDMRQNLQAAEIEIARALMAMHPEWEKDHGVVLYMDLYLGDFWDCEKSPTGNCVYNRYVDRAMDCCLFCGNPAERK